MEEYFFKINNDINKIISDIKKCHSKSMYNSLLSDLIKLYKIADILEIENVQDIDNVSFKSYSYDENKKVKKQKEQYLENKDEHKLFINNNYKVIKKLNNKKFYDVPKMNLKENLELVRDFLYYFDKNILNLFDKLLKDKSIIYLKGTKNNPALEDEGQLFYGYSNFIYILIESYNSIFTSLTTVHEIGHVYDLNHNNYNNYNYCREVYSHFIELVFIDYLEKNKYDVSDLKYDYFDSLREYLKSFSKIINSNIKTNIEFHQNFTDLYLSLEYNYGMLVALYFYEMYKEDDKIGLYNINNFIMNNANYTTINDLLNDFGLDKERILNGKILEKYLKNIKVYR